MSYVDGEQQYRIDVLPAIVLWGYEIGLQAKQAQQLLEQEEVLLISMTAEPV